MRSQLVEKGLFVVRVRRRAVIQSCRDRQILHALNLCCCETGAVWKFSSGVWGNMVEGTHLDSSMDIWNMALQMCPKRWSVVNPKAPMLATNPTDRVCSVTCLSVPSASPSRSPFSS
ncbi:hypothetical protein MPTK1_6g15030 [Marchantia polymorpha subsp. ruderalis]|uniref:Uncharacterized protein n=2 Tax=Marchantia polymorpha TaxID=3197 RepID=A0AAF6BS69_MARPO|nr:hypothetical protein MARPO_0056s0013 [Marchantia polymorpha]BBN14853.1 hypothetical protein Mp_6g15030 [Marchantia polymorpha subsp. ruderalis]|eukprot:PTQ37534.1 hypothetical protein MARPO_0056s0013 [Marchantia polymorpha]